MSTMRTKIKAILLSNKPTYEMAIEISKSVKDKGAVIENETVTFILNSSNSLTNRLFNVVESID